MQCIVDVAYVTLGVWIPLKYEISYSPHVYVDFPDSKVHGANMGPIWGRQDPGGRLNKKDGLTRYGDSHVKDKTS